MNGLDISLINVRIRGMKSRLLTEEDYDEYLKVGRRDLSRIIEELRKTTYKDAIQNNFLRSNPTETIARALFEEFTNKMNRLKKYLGEDFAGYINRFLRKWELVNIKIALRLIDNLPPEERKFMDDYCVQCLPVGRLDRNTLQLLFEARDIDHIIGILEEAKSPLVEPLREHREEEDLWRIENALDQFHYKEFLEYLENKGSMAYELIESLKEEIDYQNIQNALRWLRIKSKETVAGFDLSTFFIPNGKSFRLRTLRSILRTGSTARLLELIESFGYEKSDDVGLIYADFKPEKKDYEFLLEKAFLVKQLKRRFWKFQSFNLLVAYIFSLLVEIRNIRLLIYGINAGLSYQIIEERLIYEAVS